MCALLVAVVYYPTLVVMNTTLSLCVSGYHRYHLLYVDLFFYILHNLEPGWSSWYTDQATGWIISCSIPERGFFSSPKRPDRFWVSPNLLFRGKCFLAWLGLKLTPHLYLLPRLRVAGAVSLLPHSPLFHVQGATLLCVYITYC